ncbi:MAG: rhodanese-like domain-containing protein [Aquaticitalea sp.]
MRLLVIIIFSCFAFQANAQKTLDDLLNQYNSNRAPYISVQELAMPKTDAIILDAREPDEYEVSHLKDAVFVGYNNFTIDSIQNKVGNKDQPIVVYCSLGIRSETVADKLKKAGFTNVYNLYGGIFEWKNNNFPVFNSEGNETDNVHTFSKVWAKWLLKGNKVYGEL